MHVQLPFLPFERPIEISLFGTRGCNDRQEFAVLQPGIISHAAKRASIDAIARSLVRPIHGPLFDGAIVAPSTSTASRAAVDALGTMSGPRDISRLSLRRATDRLLLPFAGRVEIAKFRVGRGGG